jgi:hypothetical protein
MLLQKTKAKLRRDNGFGQCVSFRSRGAKQRRDWIEPMPARDPWPINFAIGRPRNPA